MELNADTSTGRIVGQGPVGATRQVVGGKDASNLQEMEKLEATIQASAGAFKGQGAVSNFERGIIGASGPRRSNNAEVNNDINRITIGAAQNAQDKIAFKQAFLAKFNTTNQADSWWNDYVNSNPNYVKGSDSRLVPNEQKMDWQTFMQYREQGMQSLPLKEGMWGKVDTMKLKQGQSYITPKGPMTWKDGKFWEQ